MLINKKPPQHRRYVVLQQPCDKTTIVGPVFDSTGYSIAMPKVLFWGA